MKNFKFKYWFNGWSEKLLDKIIPDKNEKEVEYPINLYLQLSNFTLDLNKRTIVRDAHITDSLNSFVTQDTIEIAEYKLVAVKKIKYPPTAISEKIKD